MTTTQEPAQEVAAASPAVNLFVARQPIFTRQTEVYGYELLFRSDTDNFYKATDGTQATAELIVGPILTLGLDQLTGGRPAFVNFTRQLLVTDSYALLPAERVVIELLEDIRPDEEVLDACRRLKSAGYRLALDDVVSLEDRGALLDMADVVKVDFQQASSAQRASIASELRGRRRRVDLLAEKVESQEEFEEALDLGYDYFQGHFLSRPVMIAGKEIPAFKLTLIQLLHAANKLDFDFGELEAIIKHDISLSYRMLRFANAAAHGVRHRIESVKHALVMLGQQDVVRAVSVLALAGMGADKPQELAVRSVIRAGVCESLADAASMGEHKLDPFLLGMFSLVDVILETPMSELVLLLPTSNEVDAALLGEPGKLRDVLDLAIGYEEADWTAVAMLAERLGVPAERIPTLYVESVMRADEVFAGEPT